MRIRTNELLRSTVKPLLLLLNNSGNRRNCPLCGWRGWQFLSFGKSEDCRSDARCPTCGSLERHRMAYLLLSPKIGNHHTTLHVAPEPALSPWIQSISDEYLSIDLDPSKAMRSMDLTNLELDSRTRSLVWCSHVLEHVQDDRSALMELQRVLEPGGRAVLMVPIRGRQTVEDPSVQSSEERLKRFGQRDHVRIYGEDFSDRIRRAGFILETMSDDALAIQTRKRCRTSSGAGNMIFFCKKPMG